MDENEITGVIVDCAVEVHRTLGGPGLLESVYEEALVWELERRGLDVQRQVSLPIPYKDQILATPLRIDLIVGGKVIVECKAAAKHSDLFEAQTLTYLRLTGLKVGLVVNFGERLVKNGVHRVVTTSDPSLLCASAALRLCVEFRQVLRLNLLPSLC